MLVSSYSQVPKKEANLELSKLISPGVTTGITGLQGKDLYERIFANVKEILSVNLYRLIYAYHSFSWVNNNELYLQVLEDSLDNMRFTAKAIEDLKNRFFDCGDKYKAEKLTKIYYIKAAEESRLKSFSGVSFTWGEYINQKIIEVGASFNSFSDWAFKAQYTSKWTDKAGGLHRLDLVGGMALS